MKASQRKLPAILTALFIGSYACASAFAASPASPPSPEQPAVAPPSQMEKMAGTCAKLDKDQDGTISATEWKAHKKDTKAFMAADVNQDGHLDSMECSKAMGS